MFIHQRTGSTFLVQPWTGSGANHYRLFNRPKLKIDLSVIAEHVAECMFNTNKAFVRHSTFSLVNVCSPIANLSFGYQPEPFEQLRRFHPLSFTFAFTRYNAYNPKQRPRFMVRPRPNVTFWGYNLIHNSSFMTINIPKQVMRRANLLVPNLREMEWLYMAIGGFSKGFAKQFDFYTRFGDFRTQAISHEVAYSRFFNMRFQRVLKQVPYDQWGYSKDMWLLAPNFISSRSADPSFLDYYCRYLSPYNQRPQSTNAKRIQERAISFLAEGLRDAQQDVTTLNSELARHMLPDIPDNLDYQQTARKLLLT